MTISSSINKAQYTANGATTIFAYNFLIPSAQDIQVYLNDVLQASGFTVSGYGNPAGGNVTFTTAPQSGWIVTILRVMPLTQAVDYVPYDAFPAQTHEGALDKLTMIDQQQQEQIDRSLKISVSAPTTSVVIDQPVDEAILTWELGSPGVSRIKNGPSTASIQASVDSAANSAALSAQYAVDSSNSAASAASEADAAAASAIAAEEAANNLVANKYEETTTVAKSVFTIPFAISTTSPNVMVMVNGVVQAPSAFTLTNSTTITLSETVPVGTNFFVAAAAPPTLPDFTDIVRLSAPAYKGDVLTYNGSLWAPSSVIRRNAIINGNIDISQRGQNFTGITSGQKIYVTDMLTLSHVTDGTLAAFQANNNLPAGTRGWATFCNATAIDSAINAAHWAAYEHIIEGYDAQVLYGRKVTLSFWAYATLTGIYHVSLANGGGEWSYVLPFTINASNVWEFKSVTLTMQGSSAWAADTVGGIRVRWALAAGANFIGPTGSWQNANYLAGTGQVNMLAATTNYFGIKQMQLELGEVPTNFMFRSISEELILCQRYYEKSYNMTDLPGAVQAVGSCWFVASSASEFPMAIFKVRKRTAGHTFRAYSPVTGAINQIRNATSGADVPCGSEAAGETSAYFAPTVVDGNIYYYQWTSDAGY